MPPGPEDRKKISYSEKKPRKERVNYEYVYHTADIAIRVWAGTIEDLFRNAAFAMLDVMGCVLPSKGDHIVDIKITAPDKESLLVEWLNEVLYLSVQRNFLPGSFLFRRISDKDIDVRVSGQKVDGRSISAKKEIKAVTYHGLEFKKNDKGIETVIIFDV